MRQTLIAATALVPLWLLFGLPGAEAATTISNSTAAPVATSTTGDLTVTGSITPTASGAAVTINSSNTVLNSGTLSFKDLNDSTAILVNGGNTGNVSNAATITVNESYTPTDANTDGVLEGPFASLTSSGRYGVRVVGANPFVGAITNVGGGIISVQGDKSYGISVEAPLTGSLSNLGAINISGDSSVGLRETAGVSGSVLVSGAITATGTGTNAVVLGGDVGGRFSVYAGISATGYGATTRLTTDNITLGKIESTPSELLQGGAAVVIGGSVGGGVFIGAPPATTVSTDTTTDADGDGVVDSAEGTGSIASYGSAPALIVGAAGKTITLGEVDPTGANANGYGIVLRGTIAGSGVYDGFSATGAQIGVAGGAVNVAGGLRVVGGLSASAYGASATALDILSGSTVPEIRVEGSIGAAILPPNTTTNIVPAYTAASSAIVIEQGAQVSTLTNSGTIAASLTGDQSSTYAVVDKQGSLSTVVNTGQISSLITPVTSTDAVTGTSVALDLHLNTTGVTLTQSQAPNITTTTTATDGTTTSTVTTPSAPYIVGAVSLGSGSNTVNLLAGSITGDLNLGSGPTATFTIDNAATYSGALTYSGGALVLNVNNGILDNLSASTIKASSVTVGAAGTIYFAVDPANSKATEFLVSGAATFAAGSKIGLTVISNTATTAPQTYTLVHAGTLSVASTAANLVNAVPYVFDASIVANQTAGDLSLTINQKTAAEMGLNPSQGAALGAFYSALKGDAPVQAAVLNQYTRDGFLNIYNQVLPDYAGGVFQIANAASLAISRATAESNDIENPTGTRGAWAQELVVGVNQARGQTDGFRGGGFGFVGGLETGGAGFGAVGVTGAFVTTGIGDQHVPGNSSVSMSQLEGGVYWQGELGGLAADARVGGGYLYMGGRRELVLTDPTTGGLTLDRRVKSSWNGYSLAAHAGLAYQWRLGKGFFGGGWFVQPQVHGDYFRLNEDGYSENLATGGSALAMNVDSRTGDEASGTASVLLGRSIGTGIVWRPSLELGVRDVFSGDAGSTTATFATGGSSFTLTPQDITGPAGIARLKVKASSEYYEVGVEAGGEVSNQRYQEGDVKVSFRVLF